MLVYAIAIALAVLIVPITGGRFSQLARIRLRRPWLLFGGLALQIVLELIDLPRARYDDVGLAILLASYVLIIGFGLSNLLLAGMGVITIGVALNAFVIALNQGMPYRVPEGERVEVTVKHRPEKPDDILPELGDYIMLGDPVNVSISFGDLIIGVGLVDLTYRASRRPRRARGRGRGGDGRGDEHDVDLEPVPPDGSGERSGVADGERRGTGDALQGVQDPRVVDVPGA
jgi:hypothetical protein